MLHLRASAGQRHGRVAVGFSLRRRARTRWRGNYISRRRLPANRHPLSASGLKDKTKTLKAAGKAVIHGLLLDASYWHIVGVDITDKSLRIQGSHNLIENVTAYRNDDTGIQISSPADVGRPLWASYNRVVNSESFSNEDPENKRRWLRCKNARRRGEPAGRLLLAR